MFDWRNLPGEGEAPGEWAYCFPGSTSLSLQGAHKVFRRGYSGQTTELIAADGRVLSGTPNHPVLTSRGWLSLQRVQVGDYVFNAGRKDLLTSANDADQNQPCISDCFQALVEITGRETPLGGSTFDFHGDGTNDHVDVIDLDRRLPIQRLSSGAKEVCEEVFAWADGLSSGGSRLEHRIARALAAPQRIVRGANKLLAILSGEPRHADLLRLAHASGLDSRLQEMATYDPPCDAILSRQSKLTRSGVVGGYDLSRQIYSIVRSLAVLDHNAPSAELLGEIVGMDAKSISDFGKEHALCIEPLRVIDKRRGELTGPVFNLHTVSNWYSAGGLAVHNCQCTAEPIDASDAIRMQSRQRQKRLKAERIERQQRRRGSRPPAGRTPPAPTQPQALTPPTQAAPPPPAPRPAPPPVSAVEVYEETQREQELLASMRVEAHGLVWEPRSALLAEDEEVVVVDIEKLYASLSHDPTFHVGPGGIGEIPGRTASARAFFEKAKAEGIAIHMPQLYLKVGGRAGVTDGRHRIEASRRLGFTTIPVTVDKESAEEFRARYGAAT